VQTWIDLKFADGEYSFKLGIGQIAEIERKCGSGIGAIYARTLLGRYGMGDGDIMPTQAEYRFSELVEVIRQALIGGGQGLVDGQDVKVSSVRANDLIESYVLGLTDKRMAMRQTWALAASILAALIEGYSPPKKDEPGESPATPKKGSTSRRRSPTER
jgi:hypothetical protein